MDFNKLKTFVAVAENRSFSKAGLVLGRTQPAISQAIQQLESSLGLILLERRRGKVFLTPEGAKLLQIGTKALQSLEEETAALKKDLASVTGQIRVGAVADHGRELLSSRIATFRASFPRATIQVSFGTSEEIEKRLIANELDVGILVTFKQKEFFEISRFVNEEEILVGSPGYLKTFGAIKDFAQLLDADLVDMSPDFECFRPWLMKNAKHLVTRLSHRSPAAIVESHDAIKEIVRAGLGLAMTPRHLVQDELRNGTLVHVLKHAKPTQVGVDLAVRRKRTPRLLESLFIKHLSGNRFRP